MALALLLTDAEPIVQSAQPGAAGDGIQPGEFLRRHPLAPQIALGHEGELLIQGVPEGGYSLEGGLLPGWRQQGAERLDVSIPLEHLEAGADLVDPVVNGLEFGRLVHHELRGGDLAAIVQPARDMDGLPLLFVEPEIGKGPRLL